MPGLFGLMKIMKETSISQINIQSAMDIMANSLFHRRDYVLQTTISEVHGFGIGRISHPLGKGPSWPSAYDVQVGRRNVFLHGEFSKDCAHVLGSVSLGNLQISAGEVLRKLEGYYSLVFVHHDFQSIILGVDRKGSEPMFYLEQNGFLFFAPEVKALLAVCRGRVEPDPEAIPLFLSCGHLLGDQTLVSSIKRLPGGCYLKVQENIIERESYWSFCPGEEVGQESEENLKGELEELLKESVGRNLGSPDKTMIFLSGGLDSRGILAGALLFSNNNGRLLNTVSWGIDENIPGSDAYIAKQISERFHLQHRFFQRKADKYSEVFAETNYLVDGLSDVAAFHPYEFTILKEVKEMGFDRVLRGDETFGWHGNVYSSKEALAKVGLRSIGGIHLYSKIVRPKYFRDWSEGGAAAMARVKSKIQGMEPNDAKDYVYFTHRLQTYLHSCAAYKQVLFEHRNVLLDDSILTFLRRVPWHLRLNKNLYEKAVLALYPPLNSIPFAENSGLEDWNGILKKESVLQSFMQEQLEDGNSGIWEYFDKQAVNSLFKKILSDQQVHSWSSSWGVWLRRKISGGIFSAFPRHSERIRAERFQSVISPYQALFRLLVLKNWHETFIEGKRKGS
ncbi:MAG: hypothetical protein KC643_30380 [Nitrospira sp.]|nr:hypothetical protein [Nitrospira sp.]